MKCICRKRTQSLSHTGKVITHDAGSVVEFDKCPNNFEPIEGEKASGIDFKTAEKEELLATDYDLDKLKKFIEDTFSKKAGNKGKAKTVDFLLDCRYRAVNLNDII